MQGRQGNLTHFPKKNPKKICWICRFWSPLITNYNNQACKSRNEDKGLKAAVTGEFIIFQQGSHCFSMTGSPKNARWLSPACQSVIDSIWKVPAAAARQEDTNKVTKYRAKHFLEGKCCHSNFTWNRKIMCHSSPIVNLICSVRIF